MLRRKFILTLFGGLTGATALGMGVDKIQTQSFTLYEGFVAGYQYHQGEEVEHLLVPGKELVLQREPKNPHDTLAIAIHFAGRRIGYIPRVGNQPLAALLDNGYELRANCREFDPEASVWDRVLVEVWMGGNLI